MVNYGIFYKGNAMYNLHALYLLGLRIYALVHLLTYLLTRLARGV